MVDPIIYRHGDGRVLDVFGALLVLKATAQETSGAYSLLEGTFQPGGFTPIPHTHLGEEESFFVLEGEFDFTIGDRQVREGPGAFLLVPRNTSHGFVNASNEPSTLLVLHSPALDGFFVEFAALAESGPPDPTKIGALMRKWRMEVQQS